MIQREPLLDSQGSRAIDAALSALGMPTLLLMENAGRGAAEHISHIAQRRSARSIDVVCGSGNNGGDGLVVARHLVQRGHRVRVLCTHAVSDLHGDARIMAECLLACAIPVERSEHVTPDADLIVDALVGTGLNRELTGEFARLVSAINDAKRYVVALDAPSGLDLDRGSVMGSLCIVADQTLTFGTDKLGLRTGAGPAQAGAVAVVSLGAPLPKQPAIAQRITHVACPPRPLDMHKGSAGRVLILGASPTLRGAGWLTARGAHRMGAGLVTLAALSLTDQHLLETMMCPLSDDVAAMKSELAAQLTRTHVAVVGPGLALTAWSESALSAALEFDGITVLDGDALTLIARSGQRPRGPCVLTPHPLEAARLLGHESTREVEHDRVRAAKTLAERYHATVLLKGAGTVIASIDGTIDVLPFADPTLAIAGSGDVLSGAIAARLAERRTPTDVTELHERVVQAAWAHGHAGRLLREARGATRGVLAHELADMLAIALEAS
ncbi:MAG: NAD(P)H-hydrate dehydratase [Deltaproteobacteria bacterium]|nr:NAD(P)H-hydrate dehydratase [Deltaproteobacteria bacterium]